MNEQEQQFETLVEEIVANGYALSFRLFCHSKQSKESNTSPLIEDSWLRSEG